MTGLRPYTEAELRLLHQFAFEGNRQRYWETRGLNGDPYAKLALEVTLDNSFDGRAANLWLLDVAGDALDSGEMTTAFTAASLEAYGDELILQDLDALGFAGNVEAFVSMADVVGLTGRQVWEAHLRVNDGFGLPHRAWTLDIPFRLMDMVGLDFEPVWADLIADQGNDFWAGAHFLAQVDALDIELAAAKALGTMSERELVEAELLLNYYTNNTLEIALTSPSLLDLGNPLAVITQYFGGPIEFDPSAGTFATRQPPGPTIDELLSSLVVSGGSQASLFEDIQNQFRVLERDLLASFDPLTGTYSVDPTVGPLGLSIDDLTGGLSLDLGVGSIIVDKLNGRSMFLRASAVGTPDASFSFDVYGRTLGTEVDGSISASTGLQYRGSTTGDTLKIEAGNVVPLASLLPGDTPPLPDLLVEYSTPAGPVSDLDSVFANPSITVKNPDGTTAVISLSDSFSAEVKDELTTSFSNFSIGAAQHLFAPVATGTPLDPSAVSFQELLQHPDFQSFMGGKSIEGVSQTGIVTAGDGQKLVVVETIGVNGALQRAVVNVQTDADGNLVTDAQGVAIVESASITYTTTLKSDDADPGQTDVDPDEISVIQTFTIGVDGKISVKTVDLEVQQQVQTVGAIGSIFGSAIGRAIAPDNVFADIAISTTLGTLGRNLGQEVGLHLFDDDGVAGVIGFENFFDDLGSEIVSAGIGAISSVITGELIDALGLNGTAAEVFNATAGAVINQIATNVADIAANKPDVTLFTDVNLTMVGNALGSFLGTKLADEIISFDTIGGQIGASIGGSIGSFIGQPLPVVGPFIGSFVGRIIGGLIGSLFGGTPRSAADVVWNEATGEFEVANVWSRKGGSKDAARGLASSVADSFNGVLQVIGGELVNGAEVQTGTYGMRKKDFTYRPESTRDKHAITKRTRDAGELTNFGLYHGLSDFRIAGGDPYAKRAFYRTLEAADQNSFEAETLYGNLTIAADYRGYLQNSSAINALMAAEPGSAFTAGWTITLSRAIELGLHKRHEADWYGGWEQFLEDSGLTAANLVMGLSGNERVMTVVNGSGLVVARLGDTIDTRSKDVIEGTVNGDTIDLTHQSGTATGGVDVITDTTGLTINGAAADGSAYTIDVAAVVYGGDGNDTITGGDLGNELFGEAGDDTLTGGAKADWLFGGDGNDTLYADKVGGVSDGNYLDGGAGDDVLEGRGGSDWLEGGAGIDTLRGGAGDDILAGGAGVDDVRGGSGNDQYILRTGDGADTLFDEGVDYTDPGTPQITDLAQLIADRTSGVAARNWSGGGAYVERGRAAGGEDVLVLGPGIGLEDLLFVRGGTVADPGTTDQDLVLKIIDGAPTNLTGEQVVMKNWFDPFNRIETLRLADGQEVGIGHFSSFIIGTDAAEVIVGTSGGDFIHAAGGNDQVFALFGNDLANGGAGNDVVDGGGDADVVLGADGDDMVSGGLGTDTVSGGRGSDRLLGGAGNDILAGDAGDDWIAGGSGDDIIRYGRGDGHDVVLDDFAANTWDIAWISGPGFQTGYSLVAQPFDVDGDGVVEAGETRDTLEYNGRVIFDGERWLEWVYYDFDGSGGNPGGLPDGPSGTLYHLIDGAAPLTADAGVDTLEFAIGIDINDIHMEWRGSDLVLGIARPGEDVTRFADLTDTVTLKEWGGAGAGAIERFAFFNTGLIDTTGIGQWGGGSDGADTVTGSAGRDWLTGNGGDDTVSGQGGDDILAGNAGFDVLDGGAGADVLLGGAGNDTLIGGAGGDVLVGGGGFDAASYEHATTGVTASLNDPGSNTGEAAGDSYDGIENLIGSDHADTLEGDGGANELTGGLGGDTLKGLGGDDGYLYDLGDGADTIEDTAGDDTILFGAGIALSNLSFAMAGADLVITVAAGDTITVKDFTTAANKVETLQFADGLSVNLAGLVLGTAGTSGDDFVVGGGSLSGGDGADTLLGGSGADTLTGGLGDDQLDGGAGADALAGGDGVDAAVYTGSAAGVVVDLGDGLAESGGDAAGDTLTGIEHVLGSAHADALTGDAGDNVLKGNAGNDTINGVAGANVLIGDAGDDFINGGTGEDNIDGGTGIDTIYGLGAADFINGGDGGDFLYGGLGDDTVIGGAGDDTIEGNDGADTLAGGDGVDSLAGGAGDDTLDGGAGNDSLSGGAGNDRYLFTATSGQDTVAAGGGLDEVVFDGSVAAEQVSFAKAGAGLADLVITVAGGGASITITGWFTDDANKVRRLSTASGMLSRFDLDRLFDAGATSLAFADVADLWQDPALYQDRAIITGTENNDTLGIDPDYVGGQTLIGLGGNDTLTGGDGNDTLIGGSGGDTMDGGAGDDVFLNAGESGGRDTIIGGAGYDRLVATGDNIDMRLEAISGLEEITAGGHVGVKIKSGISHATFDLTDVLLDGIERISLGGGNDTLFGSAGDDYVVGDSGNDEIHGGLGNDTIFLSSGNDTGYGDAGDDSLFGGNGEDSLFGGDGDDLLSGGDGFDTLDGGAGIDTADFSGQAVGTTIYLHDAVFGSGHAYGQQELITNVENVIGTDGVDTIWGDDGANRLDGGLGDDTLHGGLGDDTFVLEDGADSMDGGDGVDTVDYSAAGTALTVDLSLGTATVGGVTDTLTSIEAVIGGSGDDSFIGSGAGETFTGGAGNDTIDGGGGSDVAVFAGLRADYVIDTANGTVTHTPTGEVDSFTRIETLRFDDTDVSLGVNPNNRPDVLSPIPSQSLRETDTLSFQIPGSAFGDQDSDPLTYVATLAGGAPLPAWLAFDEQTGLFSGTPAVGDQATLNIEVKAFDGQAFSDPSAFTIDVLVKGAVIAGTPTGETLTGGDGHDEISGLGGDDTLIGLVGRDELDGGAGSDTADYAASPEAVSVDLATGATSGGHAAGDSYVSIENLTGSQFADTLRGDGAANLLRGLGAGDQLYGAGGDDRLEGGAGDDSLFGDDGADTLVGGTGTNSVTGGLGDDTIIGGAGADTVDGGGGSDTMDYTASSAGITIDLSAGTTAGGDAANDSLIGIENITGTALADVLTGDGAANRLDGGGGDDTLSGGAGADVLIGGAGTDTVTYAAAGAAVTAVLGGTGSQGEATGDQISGVETLIGSGFDDTLTGDGAGNTIHGGAGNDALHGQGGVDHLYGGDGDDHLYGGAGGDFLYGGAGDDHIEAGAEGDHLEGGAGNDMLMGSAGNDTYHVGRTSGHDVIDNYDQSGSLDRVVYADDVAYDSLWFERGDYNATTGVFTRNDTGGTELRVTVLGATAGTTSSVVVLGMFDATTGAMLDQYKVDMFIAGERQARDTIDVPQLLTVMQGYGAMPTGVTQVPAAVQAQVDTAWGINTAPQIELTTLGIDPTDVHVAEDGTLTLTFHVADLNAQGQVETPADALVVTARTSGSLFPAVITSTQVDASTREIVLDPNQFASGTEIITVEVSDGGVTTPLELTVTVDPVAATPSLTIADPTLATNAGAAMALGISAALGGGGDPSETLEVDITGWPAGATFSAGSDQGGGVWRVTAAQLAGLTITPPAGAGTDITLSVLARARETTGDSTAVSDPQTIDIAVNGTPTDVRVKHHVTNADITTSLAIPEITPGAIVGNLDAADPDKSEPAGDVFTYSIVDVGDADNFEIAGNELRLKTTVSLDHEDPAHATQNITVRATDQDGLTFDRALTITVTDVDEKPDQPNALPPQPIAENDPGLSVELAGSTDPEGADVDYSFSLVGGASGNAGGFFTITNDGTNTAVLSLNNNTPLDFEALQGQDYYTAINATSGYITVQYVAVDIDVTDPNANLADAHKSAVQTVLIEVSDVNERPDTPTATWQRTTPVNENTAVHIATLDATDPDGDPLTYKVTHNASYFEIKNGNQVWTKAAIDYEALGSFLRVDVKADDGPLDSATAWQKTITIANVNDNDPEFTNGTDNASGVDQYAAVSVDENTPTNTWLGPKFLASDPDGGSLSYSIIGGNTGNAFAIAPYQDGARLKILNGVDYETQTTYNLTLEVRDAGGRADTATIQVNVSNITEYQMIIDMDEVNFADFSGNPPTSGTGENGLAIGYKMRYQGPDIWAGWGPRVFVWRESDNVLILHLLSSHHLWVEDWLVPEIAPGYEYNKETEEFRVNLDFFSPIAIDLDGDGVELISNQASSVAFDLDGDGVADRTGWVEADDALLVLDRNGDGVIGDGSEISFVQDLPGATTDMEGLVAFDTNADGLFDGADTRFGEFQLWQDANQNGVSEAEELRSLAEAGIAGIDLALTPTGQTVEGAHDNVIVNTAEFIRTDGTTGLVGDAAFAYVPGTPATAAAAPAADDAVARLIQAMAAFDPAPSAAFDRRDRDARPRPLNLAVNDHT